MRLKPGASSLQDIAELAKAVPEFKAVAVVEGLVVLTPVCSGIGDKTEGIKIL